ncbi:hypothetical protein [Sphingomonas flavalba]|uniref:hypothetical protein n=1 Tax=Sphingomonas flavalba TaxID=2559804 RepID=UPI00109E181A|nr:hypothetical protein [Sphingomonas flavalba]
MAMESEAMRHVRALLCARIDGIADDMRRRRPVRLCENVDLVRGMAQAHGLLPLAQLASALATALAAGERGARVADCLDLMREAAGHAPGDALTGEAFAALISVRYSG